MHFRNSWMRSMSSCCIRHVPSASRGRGLNGGTFFAISKLRETSVTRSLMIGKARIGVTVIGSPSGEVRHARHAHQPRLAVDLRAARSASPRLAVPAHGERRLLLGLDVVNGVEHDHPGVGLDLVGLELAPRSSRRGRRCSVAFLLGRSASSTSFSSSTAWISGGGVGVRDFVDLHPASASCATTMFTFEKCPLSISGKSSRACPPRLSLRASAARAIASLTMSMLRMSIAWCHAAL